MRWPWAFHANQYVSNAIPWDPVSRWLNFTRQSLKVKNELESDNPTTDIFSTLKVYHPDFWWFLLLASPIPQLGWWHLVHVTVGHLESLDVGGSIWEAHVGQLLQPQSPQVSRFQAGLPCIQSLVFTRKRGQHGEMWKFWKMFRAMNSWQTLRSQILVGARISTKSHQQKRHPGRVLVSEVAGCVANLSSAGLHGGFVSRT